MTTTAREPAPKQHIPPQHPRTPPPVSLTRLYLLRGGYLLMGGGLALTKWPLLVDHPQPWPLFEGVVAAMLVSMSLLALLGLRHPLKMLPILLFELGWKLIWVASVVLPLWRADRLDADTARIFGTCLLVLVVAAVVPWRHVVAQYVTAKGDRWR